MRARNIRLDPDRLQRAHEQFVELGGRWALRYDRSSRTASAHDVALPEPLRDAARREADRLPTPRARRRTPRHADPSDRGRRPDRCHRQQRSRGCRSQLRTTRRAGRRQPTPRALDTLNSIAYEALVLGDERWRIAERHGLDPLEISELLEELGWHAPSPHRRRRSSSSGRRMSRIRIETDGPFGHQAPVFFVDGDEETEISSACTGIHFDTTVDGINTATLELVKVEGKLEAELIDVVLKHVRPRRMVAEESAT